MFKINLKNMPSKYALSHAYSQQSTLRKYNNKYVRFLLLSTIGAFLMTSSVFAAETKASATEVTTIHNGAYSIQNLNVVPKAKATVGVIPYYLKDNQVYVLLGRERIDGIKKERAGKFSDFGGSVELDGTTLVQNAIRELQEESMGQIVLKENDLLTKGKVLYKKSSSNRDIFYIFYPMSVEEYNKTKNLDEFWSTQCSHSVEVSNCEKDLFVWLKADVLPLNQEQMQDIDGKHINISLREFFKQDCIQNPSFRQIISSLVNF